MNGAGRSPGAGPRATGGSAGEADPARLRAALAAAQARIEELQRAQRLQQALYEIADVSSAGLDMQEMLRRIHAILGGLTYAENCYIVLYDRDGGEHLRFLYFVDRSDPYVNDPDAAIPVAPSETSLTLALLRGGEPMRGPSRLLREQHGVPWDDVNGPDSADWLGVPMLRDGQVVGGIVVQSYEQPQVYDDGDRALLAYVAQHILAALDRRRARDELERRVEERTAELRQANRDLQTEIAERKRAQEIQRALFRIAELSLGTRSMEQFYAEVHAVVAGLLYARNLYIAMLSEDGTRLEFPYSVDERDPHRRARPLGKGLTEYVLRTGKPLLVDLARVHALEASGQIQTLGSPAHCWLGVPLQREDKVVGVLAVQSYTPQISFSPQDQELLTFVAFHIANGLARKQAQERLIQAYAGLEQRVEERTRELAEANAELMQQIGERLRVERKLTHQATHDALTGLPNRAQLLERLSGAIARAREGGQAGFAVLFLDLDRFKLVNDSVGHQVGDELLVEAARRIVGAVRTADMVARLGGDEFAILACDLEGAETAMELGRRVLAALGAPVWIAGRELFPTASIGIAMWHPRYHGGEDMLRDADAAMYRAKGEGRDRCVLFDAGMREQAVRALDLEADLRRAIHAEAFEPHFQPIVRLADAEVVGHEALLRWRHDRRGLLAPDAFLDVGEDSGLIEVVDWLLYARVVEGMARGRTPGYVAINVSPRHFRSPGFAARLLGLLEDAHVDPARLRIEITEVALLDEEPRTSRSLQQLRERGVLAQLDDFGTGFSALSYLHRFPIAALKIDRSFIAGLDASAGSENRAVVRAIIALADSLGIETIAEGVETTAQRDVLRQLGCGYAQGYLFGRPAAAAEG